MRRAVQRLCTRGPALRPLRSLSSAAASLPPRRQGAPPGLVFDIDGVLMLGSHVIPRAIDALRSVTAVEDGGTSRNPIPWIMLTNGGGVVEAEKAAQLSKYLQIRVRPEQVVCSHTPMQSLVPKYKKDLVLAVGRHDVRKVALAYGFERVLSPVHMAHHFPYLVPIAHDTPVQAAEALSVAVPSASASASTASAGGARSTNDAADAAAALLVDEYKKLMAAQGLRSAGVSAIMVFSDPRDWYRDVQVILDCLLGQIHPKAAQEGWKQPALYFSNPDFLFSGKHSAPRLAQGSFQITLSALYKELTGRELEFTCFGKPLPVTYRWAEKVLAARAKQMGFQEVGDIYGIGDNPHADIRGANSAGDQWTSVLVRSGTIMPTSDPLNQPKLTFDDVFDAVSYVIDTHQVRR